MFRKSLLKKKKYDVPANYNKDIKGLMEQAQKHVLNEKKEEAVDLLNSALELAEIYYGSDRYEVLVIKDGIADLLVKGRNYEEALEMYTGILEYAHETKKHMTFFDNVRSKEAKTVGHINTTSKNRMKQLKNKSTLDFDLAMVNLQLQHYDKAKLCVLRALGATKMLYGINHRNIIKLRELLGDIHVKKEEYEEAKEVFQSLLITLERKKLKNDTKYKEIQKKLDDLPSIFVTGSISSSIIESIRTLKTNLSGKSSSNLRAQENESSAFTAMIDLRIELGIGHLEKGNLELANDYLTNALEGLLSLYGENNMEVARVQEYLGDISIQKNEIEEAHGLYNTAMNTIENVMGNNSDAYQKLLRKVNKCVTQTGHEANADVYDQNQNKNSAAIALEAKNRRHDQNGVIDDISVDRSPKYKTKGPVLDQNIHKIIDRRGDKSNDRVRDQNEVTVNISTDGLPKKGLCSLGNIENGEEFTFSKDFLTQLDDVISKCN